MTRADWLWLLTKAAGLWLLVLTVENVTRPEFSWFSERLAEHGQDNVLRVLIPLVAGGVLLFTDCARWFGHSTGPTTRADTAAPATVGDMPCEHWLWVGLKVVGAYGLVTSALSVPWMWLAGFPSDSRWRVLMSTVVPAVLSLWLLFGNRAYRWASRRTPRAPSPLPPPREQADSAQ